MEKPVPHVDYIIMFTSDSVTDSVLYSCIYSQNALVSSINKQEEPSEKTLRKF